MSADDDVTGGPLPPEINLAAALIRDAIPASNFVQDANNSLTHLSTGGGVIYSLSVDELMASSPVFNTAHPGWQEDYKRMRPELMKKTGLSDDELVRKYMAVLLKLPVQPSSGGHEYDHQFIQKYIIEKALEPPKPVDPTANFPMAQLRKIFAYKVKDDLLVETWNDNLANYKENLTNLERLKMIANKFNRVPLTREEDDQIVDLTDPYYRGSPDDMPPPDPDPPAAADTSVDLPPSQQSIRKYDDVADLIQQFFPQITEDRRREIYEQGVKEGVVSDLQMLDYFESKRQNIWDITHGSLVVGADGTFSQWAEANGLTLTDPALASLAALKYTHERHDFEDWVESTPNTDGRSSDELRYMYSLQKTESFQDYLARTRKSYSYDILPDDLVLSEYRSKLLEHGDNLQDVLDAEFEQYEQFEKFKAANVDNVDELLFQQFLHSQQPPPTVTTTTEPVANYSDIFRVVGLLSNIF